MNVKLTIESIGDFLSKLAEKSQHVYWLSSPDFKRVVYISPAYEEIWGRSRESLYDNPTSWIEHLHPDDLKNYHPIYEMAKRIEEEGMEARYDEHYRIVRPDGSVRYITDHGFPIYIDGQCYGVTGVAIDITKEMILEEEREKARRKQELAEKNRTDFIHNIEHDIRTPFSGIYGMSKILAEQETDKEKKEALYDIMNSAKELLDYCNSIVDFSKIELGDYPVAKESFNLKELCNKIYAIENPPAKIKNLQFSIDYDEQLPERLVGDPSRLYRILINLVSNAIKFTDSGYVKLRTQLLEKTDDQHVTMKIIVEDSGIGIPSDRQEYIYEKFSKLNPSNRGRYKGIGLGLKVVKQYVDEMGGTILVESQPNVGSQFHCTFQFKLPSH